MAKATDPKRESVAVRFSWGDGDTSDWSNWVASGETVAQSHSWKSPGSYDVMLQARDKQGATSGWSECHAVAVALPPGTLKWRYRIDGTVGSPAIGPDGTIYVCSFVLRPECRKEFEEEYGSGADLTKYFDSWVHAINPDGTLRWCSKTGQGCSNGSPEFGPDGTVYANGYAFTFTSEGLSRTAQDRTPAATGAEGVFYEPHYSAVLIAYNPDGSVKWSLQEDEGMWAGSSIFFSIQEVSGEPFLGSPAIGQDGTIYYGHRQGGFYAIRPDGTIKWKLEIDAGVVSSPVIGADGTVYFGGRDGYFYAVTPDGRVKWRFDVGASAEAEVVATPVIAADGTIYVGSKDSYLYALTPDGTLKWRFKTEGEIVASPTIGPDGTLYFGSKDGYLYAVQDTLGGVK
ncbi:MAG: PQQ-binding-like beta-propeller repeat protein [candidate division WOR-3 bacterium]